jgi:4-phytase / acid phosphatase
LTAIRTAILIFILSLSLGAVAPAANASDLRMVIVMSRHGVRSPSHPAELNAYANQPWPAWSGKPGNLTPHGATLMKQLGAYYRNEYDGLLEGTGRRCPAAGSVFVWADVDERTVASGNALLQGLAPGCGIAVQHAAADPDKLFDPLPGTGTVDKAEATASVLGAIGGGFAGIPAAYGGAFATMEQVLGCATPSSCKQISRIPTTLSNDGDGGLASLNGGLDMAGDVAENMLLEYTNGNAQVGWGRVDHAKLLQLLQLHVLGKELEHGNRYTARAHSSNIMSHILQTLQAGATGQAVSGTRIPPETRFIFLSGHDTQLAEFSGLLGLSWLVEGDQVNDTPPGSALIFELYAPREGAAPYVRTYFSAQSLDAMRSGHGEKPIRVPVYVPGCPGYSCPFSTFSKIVQGAIDPAFVTNW